MNQDFSYSYILITAAHNEEAYIEKTIKSVISQTVTPKKWVILSDGSTDKTDEIVLRYCKEYNWIDFVRLPEHRERNFAAKALCFNAGFQRVRNMKFDIVGNIDADISFDEDFFEFLLGKFSMHTNLGVAGAPFVEQSFRSYHHSYTDFNHVSGACQLFRRGCLEELGGYLPIEEGGIDWIAVTTARMNGWLTRTFMEKTYFHHRKIGTGNNSAVVACFKHGMKDHFLGGHPLWEIIRAIHRLKSRPFIVGGIALFLGYFWAMIKRVDVKLPKELRRFHRNEQLNRLKSNMMRFFIRKSLIGKP